ncbi:MAG: DnaJ C-terminal domain-containing protein, partial [Planctomycetota bacterium]
RRGRRVRKGRDVRCDVTLTLKEAAEGVRKTVEFRRNEPCETCGGDGAAPGTSRETCSYCGGRGQVLQQAGIIRVQTTCPQCGGTGSLVGKPCVDCRGSGSKPQRVTIEVDIPAGVDDGMQVRISGEGEPGPPGGQPGDCYCFVTVEEHPLLERDGQHLICRVPITYSQAVLGCELEVPTLDAAIELKVPRGTPSGEVFRMRGHGLRDPRVSGVGDLLVQVQIEVPKSIGEEEEVLLRQLAELEHKNVAPERKGFFETVKELFTGEEASSEG